ncbi:hypothetical protein GCM10007421_34030 [Halopseudomonas oceani]|uniref:DUF998 domain-containing protein n=1 Tax=Halopseudomonas oceani TaxID=1708783 RepID=A0A2P4EYH9_9GAMM|nr:DUF998 domain-containing protein [Halopseudomonas oceani]POB05525.1 DUF998 domain-containing protein [Halopseudomonas oceani]GGE56640.1 hypothetical protein GCM10007421_34030 [Halopseudomonas oceani]
MKKLALFSGILIPVWLLCGVLIAGALYPGYSHVDQAMSALGAVDAPTHRLSPIINNFPLGALFMLFGGAVFMALPGARLAQLSGLLIVLHGLASVSAGVFSCDPGCNSVEPSADQVLHNLSGLVMFASLTLANLLWVYLARKQLGSTGFSWFSLSCLVLSLAVMPMMAAAVESGEAFGLYQRINYGVSVIWLGALAWMLIRRLPVDSAGSRSVAYE